MSSRAQRNEDKAKGVAQHARDFHVALCWRGKGGDNDQFIGYDRSFTEEEARKEQQRIIDSPTFRATDAGTMSVVVMHWRTWKRMIKAGDACTYNRIQQNMNMYGTGLLSASPLAQHHRDYGHLVKL